LINLWCATGNPGKLREFRMAALHAPVEIELLQNYKQLPPCVEDGATFEENAVKKALHYAPHAPGPLFADDSGLVVEALGGAPGVYSARWAGADKDFGAAMARVERELRALAAPAPWRAHFVSVLALALPDGGLETFGGRVDGTLVFPPRGTAGFGYDPIFRPDGHDHTFGEMSAEEKHGIPADGSLALSHRARAFQKLAHARL